jgi:hypothetical protein
MAERKTALTFEEKITAAFMHYVRQVDQQDIAMMYGVNGGRVNEACLAIYKTFNPPSGTAETELARKMYAADQGKLQGVYNPVVKEANG